MEDLSLTKKQTEFFKENLHLVLYVVNRVAPSSCGVLDKDDFIVEGQAGLVKAIKNYTPDKGSFSSFACPCIKNAITDAIRRECNQRNFTSDITVEDMSELNMEAEYGVYTEEDVGDMMVKNQFIDELYAIAERSSSNCVKLGIEALILRHHRGMEDSDIANLLRIDQKTVRSYISRARIFLRSLPSLEMYKNL